VSRKECPRPLDLIDAEALAAGVEPLFASDAAEHAAECPSCSSLVAQAAAFAERQGRIFQVPASVDLADRVERLRPLSRRERGRLVLWAGPCAFAVILLCAGLLFLAFPGISAREQTSLLMAAYAPLLAVSRACVGWLLGLIASAPAGLEGLSQALRGEPLPGFAALLLLAPFWLGLKRVLTRARR
jgi:hypothetical protein